MLSSPNDASIARLFAFRREKTGFTVEKATPYVGALRTSLPDGSVCNRLQVTDAVNVEVGPEILDIVRSMSGLTELA